MRVTQPTNASQYFHLLRSQVRGLGRHPLIVMTPKSLLRSRASRSPLTDLTAGSFEEVLDDPAATSRASGTDEGATFSPGTVSRVILCSGKIAFDVIERRRRLIAGEEGLPQPGVDPAAVAVVRLKQLYPWPETALSNVLSHYPAAQDVIWLQDEPENMGAWNFVHGRLHRLLRERYNLRHVSRAESASPATGSAALHQLELEDLLKSAFA